MAVEIVGAHVDCETAARMLRCAARTVRRMLKAGRLSAQEDGQHPNGKARLLIPIAQVNARLAERQGRALPARCGTALAELPPADPPAVAEPQQLTLFGGIGRPAHLPITKDGLPDLAAMRASGLDHEADEFNRRSTLMSEVKDVRRSAGYGEIGRRMDEMVKQKGLSRRTAYRWAKNEREGGAAALVPDWRNKAGDTVLPDDLQRHVLDFYLGQHRPTFEQVHRHVVVPYYSSDGRQCPTVGCVRRLIRARVTPLDEAVFRHGPKAYAQTMQPRVTRELPPVGSVWSCDHRLLDVVVCDCSEPGKERPVRPWLTAIWDVGSAALVGSRLMDRPTSDAVAHALFSALLNWGAPDVIQTDNDKTYTARRFGGKRRRGKAATGTALPDGADDPGLWAALGVRLTRALPYNAPAKPAEAYFGALARLEENLVPGWCGRSPSGKPESLKRQIERGQLLTWEEHERYFADLVRRWNHDHICGDRSAPPGRMYADAPPRKKWDASTLAFLLQRRQSARVGPKGVMIGGRFYWEAEHLPIYVGQTVEVRYDPATPEFAFAYVDGRSLTLTPKPLANWQDPKSEAVLLAKRGARLQRQYVAQLAAVVKGTCPIPHMDPTGAVRMVRDRKLAERAEQKALNAMLTDEQVAATQVVKPVFPSDWNFGMGRYATSQVRQDLLDFRGLCKGDDDLDAWRRDTNLDAEGRAYQERRAALIRIMDELTEAHDTRGREARDEALADFAVRLQHSSVRTFLTDAPDSLLRLLARVGVYPLSEDRRIRGLVAERRKAARAAELSKAEPGIFPRTSTDWGSIVKLIALTEAAPLVPLFQEIAAADALADAAERDAALARLGARLRQAETRKHMRKLPVNVKRVIKATGLTLGKVWDSPCGDAIRAAEQEIKKEARHAA